jgi:hypothetical protein
MGALPRSSGWPKPASADAPSQVTVEATDPAAVVMQAGSQIMDAYRRYDELRALTSLINGLSESAPLPDQLKIAEITIDFTVNGVARQAKTRTVQRVGDLYRLLALETEALVLEMRNEALKAREAADTIEAACGRSQYVANARQTGQPG